MQGDTTTPPFGAEAFDPVTQHLIRVQYEKAAAAEEAGKVEAPPPPEKIYPPLRKRINKTDLRIIRTKLFQRRDELAGTIDSIESEHLGTHENRTTTGGDEADLANSAQSADISLRLAESGSKELKEIDVAIAKISDGTYGICEATGDLIGLPRLKFMPWTRLSLGAQEQVEKNELRYDESAGWIFP